MGDAEPPLRPASWTSRGLRRGQWPEEGYAQHLRCRGVRCEPPQPAAARPWWPPRPLRDLHRAGLRRPGWPLWWQERYPLHREEGLPCASYHDETAISLASSIP